MQVEAVKQQLRLSAVIAHQVACQRVKNKADAVCAGALGVDDALLQPQPVFERAKGVEVLPISLKRWLPSLQGATARAEGHEHEQVACEHEH